MRITWFRLKERTRAFCRTVVTFFEKPAVRKTLLRGLSAALAVLLIVFCFYHFTQMPDSGIETILVTEDTVLSTLTGEAVLFREEIALDTANAGLTVPLVAEGAHVARDTELARVYPTGAENTDYYRTLCESIDRFTLAKGEGDSLADLAALEQKIRALALQTVSLLESGRGGAAATLLEELRVLYSRIEALKSDGFSLSGLIRELSSIRDSLIAEAGDSYETLVSEIGGYYYPYADGYGALCTPEALETLTGRDLLTIAETVKEDAEAPHGGVLLPSAEWFLALPIDLSSDALAEIPIGATYTVILSDEGGIEIPMTVTRTVEGTEDTPAVIVFSTLRMPEGFSFRRVQSVTVVTDSVTGFSIPLTALHQLDGIPGVYVLDGNMMVFCRVEILGEYGARYLVKTTDPTPDTEYTTNTYRYVAAYDAVILSGGDLFHGRVFS